MGCGKTTAASIWVSTNSFTVDIQWQIQVYDNTSYNSPEENNTLSFWRHKQKTLPILSKIAKSAFVIQVSSGESEQHLSMAGQTVTEETSPMDPECVEAVVVLKEALLSNM